jgi:hypothetical protein
VAVVAVVVALATLLEERPRGRAQRLKLLPYLALLTGGAAIAFAAWIAHQGRCGQGCDHEPFGDTGIAGFRGWWHRHDSWQWSAQLTLAAAGLALSAVAFALAARGHRRARVLLWAARIVYIVWVAVVFVVPGAYALFT